MKRIISIALLYSILGVSLGVAQEQSQEFNSLNDYYVVTEMYNVNALTKEVVEYEKEFLNGFIMIRNEFPQGVVQHSIMSRIEDDYFAVAIGNSTECDGLVTDSTKSKKTICYEGEVLSKEFNEKDGYLFVFEELMLTPEIEEKGYNVVSFNYYFLPNSFLQVVGVKVQSNYDPKYVKNLDSYSAIELIKTGSLLFHNEKFSLAVFYLSKAMEKDSTIATTRLHNTLASAKVEIFDYEGALNEYSKAIAINPNDIESLMNRGLAFFVFLNDYAAAISDFERAIEINPTFCHSYYMKGEVFYEQSAIDKACKAWRKAHELGCEEAAERIETHCDKN